MLRQGNCVKLFTSASSGDLECRAGESLLIRRIETFQNSGARDITLKTERVTVGFWRVLGKACGHIGSILGNSIKFNLMEWLENKGVNVAYPVAEGQVFSWETTASVDAVMILFDRYDAGDILKTAPNGSESKEYVFAQYMNVGTGLSVSGNALLDVSLSPAEFPDFPCGKVVPARHKISLLGLIGCPWTDGDSGPKGFYTTHIKLVKDREVLFDIDRVGLPFQSGSLTGTGTWYGTDWSLIGCGLHTFGMYNQPAGKPLLFDPPLEFVSGEELNMYVVCVAYGTTPSWDTTVPDIAAILKVVKE